MSCDSKAVYLIVYTKYFPFNALSCFPPSSSQRIGVMSVNQVFHLVQNLEEQYNNLYGLLEETTTEITQLQHQRNDILAEQSENQTSLREILYTSAQIELECSIIHTRPDPRLKVHELGFEDDISTQKTLSTLEYCREM